MALALRRRYSGFMARPRVARARTRVVHHVRRGASNLKARNKHRLPALVAAGFFGFLKGNGTAIPHIEKLGVEGTYGLAAFMAAQMGKAPAWVDHAATGLLAVALHEAAQSFGGGTSGDFDAGQLEFDDDDVDAAQG